MKPILLLLPILALSACATTRGTADDARSPSKQQSALMLQLAGTWDNHAQVWQAKQDQAQLAPAHVRQTLAMVDGDTNRWQWSLALQSGTPSAATAPVLWQYQVRSTDDGGLEWMPMRKLPTAQRGDDGSEWAPLVPCALRGRIDEGQLQLQADRQACTAMVATLGGKAALLPLALKFNGQELTVQTVADLARGNDARQRAQRVDWYEAWLVINGAGPNADSGADDWHQQRRIRIGNQGRAVPIHWRDGKRSGYALRLETRYYRKRNMRVLQLSVIRDPGGTVAYAWAEPGSRYIGLNLGWLQVGLQRGQGGEQADP